MCSTSRSARAILKSLAALPVLLALQANAALINVDWRTPGDGLMVRDTRTNIEWLKLTETTGLSYAEITAQLGGGGDFEGLRYATNAECQALFGEYFAIDLSAGRSRSVFAYLDPGVRLASETLGDGVSGGTDEQSGPNANYRLVGLTGETMLDGVQFAIGAVTRWSDTDYYTVKDPLDPFFDVYAGDFDWIGSYLVRVTEVPLPGALWLFSVGLIALQAVGRRSRK